MESLNKTVIIKGVQCALNSYKLKIILKRFKSF